MNSPAAFWIGCNASFLIGVGLVLWHYLAAFHRRLREVELLAHPVVDIGREVRSELRKIDGERYAAVHRDLTNMAKAPRIHLRQEFRAGSAIGESIPIVRDPPYNNPGEKR